MELLCDGDTWALLTSSKNQIPGKQVAKSLNHWWGEWIYYVFCFFNALLQSTSRCLGLSWDSGPQIFSLKTQQQEGKKNPHTCIRPKLVYIQGLPHFQSSWTRKPTVEATHKANNSSHSTSDHLIKPSSYSDGGMGKIKKELKRWSQAHSITILQSSLTEIYHSFNIHLNILIYGKQFL